MTMADERFVSDACVPSPPAFETFLSAGARALAAMRDRGGAIGPVVMTPRINLANNESVFGPSPKVHATLQEALVEPKLSRYPSGLLLCKQIGEELGVDTAMVALGNGSNEILELIAATFLSPDVEVICPRLSYPMFTMLGTLSGATVRSPTAKSWGYDLGAIRMAIGERTRLVFIANPNNPTGTMLSSQELEEFLQAVPPHVLVVLDEAYRDYTSDLPMVPDGVRWLAQHRNLIVIRTFSKAHGLAALRVGYAVAAPELITAIQSSGQPNNVNFLALVAAQAALSDPGHVARVRIANRDALARMVTKLEACGIHCEPSQVNFVLANLGKKGAEIVRELAQQGITVGSLALYGIADYVRITVGTDSEIDGLIAALRLCPSFEGA